MTENKIWQWRKAIKRDKNLAASTVLVLLNLADYMDEKGACYPSTKRQAEDTHLSERAVCEHLAKAEQAGYLKKSRHVEGGRGWSSHRYGALIPTENAREFGTDIGAEGADIGAEGTDDNDTMALTQRQSNYHELPVVETTAAVPEDGEDENQIVFSGKVIRLSRKHFNTRCAQYGLTARRMADWLQDRDRWLSTLPSHDRRVANWWFGTWRVLEKDLDSLRICDAYAGRAEAERREDVVVWG